MEHDQRRDVQAPAKAQPGEASADLIGENVDPDALDPALMLAVLRAEAARTEAKMMRMTPWIMLSWGVSWVVGFAILGLAFTPDAPVSIPIPVAYSVFAALLATAAVISGVGGARQSAGVRQSPQSLSRERAFIVMAVALFIGISALGGSLRPAGASSELLVRFFPIAIVIVVGGMYIGASAVWGGTLGMITGLIVIVGGIAAAYTPGANFFFALAAVSGGALVAAGLYSLSRVRQALRS